MIIIQTAGRLDQLQRALTNIEGSSESAQVRFQQLRARFAHLWRVLTCRDGGLIRGSRRSRADGVLAAVALA